MPYSYYIKQYSQQLEDINQKISNDKTGSYTLCMAQPKLEELFKHTNWYHSLLVSMNVEDKYILEINKVIKQVKNSLQLVNDSIAAERAKYLGANNDWETYRKIYTKTRN